MVQAIAAADYDGDGVVELAGAGGNHVFIVRGQGHGTFLPAMQVATVGQAPAWIEAADLNADTYLDLVLVNFGSNDVSLYLTKGGPVLSNGDFGGRRHDSAAHRPRCARRETNPTPCLPRQRSPRWQMMDLSNRTTTYYANLYPQSESPFSSIILDAIVFQESANLTVS